MKKQREVEIDQGDVFFVRMSIPKEAKPVARTLRGLVLAEGEETGHCHAVENMDAELFEHEGILYLRVDGEEITVKHEEHAPVTVSKGEWRVGVVREVDPFDQEVRRVRD